MIGQAPAFLRVMETVSQIAPLEKPVLVVGERGTGKELIAERLHYLSNRWEAEFLKLNCAALAESLLESELFGHEPGAFTGAGKLHKGRFERADGGTLFLDELATTTPRVQEKLLRVIEYGEFERLGGSRTLTTNVRLVAATNQDLPALAERGEFRADLLDRLAFDVITLPPLRARREDILLLAEHFAINMASELEFELFPGFSQSVQQQLLDHAWPGNVRELKNVVERCVYRWQDRAEPVDEVVFDPFESPWRPASPASPASRHDDSAARAPAATEATEAPGLPMDFKAHIRDHEIALLERALEANRFNQRRTAEALGMTYHQLRGYLRKYEMLDRQESDA